VETTKPPAPLLARESPESRVSKEEKEKHIERTLRNWGAPEQELSRSAPAESHVPDQTEQIRSAVVSWSGSSDGLSSSTGKMRAAREKSREKEQERQRRERVRSVVHHWKDGPPFMHAILGEPKRRKGSASSSPTHGAESPISPSSSSSSGGGLRRSSSKKLARRKSTVNVDNVLLECRLMHKPSVEDISRMAAVTRVSSLPFSSQPSQVLESLARLLKDEESLRLFSPSSSLDEVYESLSPDSPTLGVARVIARAVVAPIEHALKDACPYAFNFVRQSWLVRVEKFSAQTIVTHSRLEHSAPGHDETFQFGWSVSFILRNVPVEICELFIELTQLTVEGSKAQQDRITKAIEGIFTGD